MTIEVVNPPVVSDGDLLFDESETRSIFSFYWPHLKADIAVMEITTENRRFGQQLLIIGIDSSYAIGFVQKLMETLARPQAGFAGLAKMGMKLAQRYIQHWWKHARQKDLENPRVAEGVRIVVARNFKTEMELVIKTAGYGPTLKPFHVAGDPLFFWGAA